MTFANRCDAGQQLAEALREYAGRVDLAVLALPRGGVPVGAEIAVALRAPLEVFVVRKLGVPSQEELAFGAIASGGVRVFNPEVLAQMTLDRAGLEAIVQREQAELERRERDYRGDRAPLAVAGQTAILVDDGLATGASMKAAILALRQLRPAGIVVAVPVGAPSTCAAIAALVDRLVCLQTPAWFQAVGEWYDDFSQTTDDEVRATLDRTRHTTARSIG